jgi:hypothetical protein
MAAIFSRARCSRARLLLDMAGLAAGS